MNSFQMQGEGRGKGKFSLVTVQNVYTDLPENQDYEHQIADGIWIFKSVPVNIDTYWKKWIGTIRLETLEKSNLVILCSESSPAPQVLDKPQQRLNEKVSRIFYLLRLSGVIEYERANLLSGFFSEDRSEVRHMSEFPTFYNTKEYNRIPVNIERLEKAVRLESALEKISSTQVDFRRFIQGLKVLWEGFKQQLGEERIHQFVRALEAIILPRIGHTKQDFVHRCQTFVKANPGTRKLLEEGFNLRSMAEHLNNWEQTLESYPQDGREIIALHRTHQMENIASFAYSRLLETESIQKHFINEDQLESFWKLRDDVRKNIWGTQLDLIMRNTVREFDSWGREMLDSF